MRRYLLLVGVVTVAAGLLLLFPVAAQALPPAPTAPEYRLNSEGDEWVRVDPTQVEPKPAAPAAGITRQEEQPGAPASAAVISRADPALLLSLERAREAGPEAVLAFVSSQPDPSLELLQAARQDAETELAPAAPARPAAPNVNRVSLNSGPCAFETIQAAVAAAANGDVVRVAGGLYTETINLSAKQITIEGGYDSGCSALVVGGVAHVNGNGGGSVVDMTSASRLTLRNMTLTGGSSFGGGLDLLGGSQAVLDNSDIHGNTASTGAGIYIGSTSAVTFTNDSDIYLNTASSSGGGAIVYGRLYGSQTSSDIYQNTAINGGGLAVLAGRVILDNADVVANTASGLGGGIYMVGGEITLSNSVFVGETAPCCQSAVTGGGIYADGGRVNLLGTTTTVMNNTATDSGGGLYLLDGSRLVMTGGRLGHETLGSAGNDAVLGAGMYVISSTVDFSGSIINNIASNSGGGLYASDSTITLTHATVGGLGTNQHNRIGATGLNGAGMYLINNTRARLDDTSIVSNTLSNPATGYAGGIYIRAGSVLTATNSRISQHVLPSAFDGRGAAIYIYDSTVSISNTQVISNTANNLGGGVRLFGISTLNLWDGSAMINNKALHGVGGAIAATNTPTIRVNNATLRANSASSHGGAAYLDAGSLLFDGFWEVSTNQSGGNGGAVAVTGAGNVDFNATSASTASSLSDNLAAGSGGALFVSSTSAVQLYATSGSLLSVQNNRAGGDGGAMYANVATFFDVYGQLDFSGNQATGNGGVFFLGNGSRLWMDDYFDIPPMVGVNTAANGGAIYASDSPRVECDGVGFGLENDGNKATAGSGGAIYLSGSSFTADNCTFRSNQAQAGDGGAIAAYTSTVRIDTDYPATAAPASERLSPDAPQATACNPNQRRCSSLSGNTASSASGDGGAIYSSDSNLKVINTIFDQNLAQRGGAIFQTGAAASGVISNTLVYSNTSLVSFGAGIRAAGGSMTLMHATLANNSGGAGYSPGSVQSHVYNSIIWGNSVAAFGALTTAVCNIDQGGTAGPATNPLFMAPGGGEDYRLKPGSPAQDACTTGLPGDLLNIPRPSGSLYDMGVFELVMRYLYLPVLRK